MSRKTNHRVHAVFVRRIEDPVEATATVIRRVLGGKWTMSPEAVRNSAVRKAADRAAKRARPLAANERASIATVDGAARMLATLEHYGLPPMFYGVEDEAERLEMIRSSGLTMLPVRQKFWKRLRAIRWRGKIYTPSRA